ncbi:MAG: NAD(P)-dependent glycerol-3-phosphate dehydrogenase [Fimbriimonadia bacterium]
MSEAVIVGAGSWGTALALVLGRKEVPVSLWGRDGAEIARLRASRVNEKYLPGHPLPECVQAFDDLEEAADAARVAILAVPSGAAREVLQRCVAVPRLRDLPWVMAAKGLEGATGRLMSELALEVLGPQARVAALSGPNLAKELAAGLPTATVIASRVSGLAADLQTLFMSPTLRVYTGEDVVGVELAGALKNVLAIGGGMTDGLGFRDNTKAAVLTRGLAEMARLGEAMGAEPRTFMGLAGVGDLFATAVSTYSRNYRVGHAVGRGVPLEDAIREVQQVAEGVPTAHAAVLLSERYHVEMPLFHAIHRVLSGTLAPMDAVRELMHRTPKGE